MALTDIDFQEAEGQCFILERPSGTLNAPVDIVVEPSSEGYYVNDIPEINSGGGGGSIFILQD